MIALIEQDNSVVPQQIQGDEFTVLVNFNGLSGINLGLLTKKIIIHYMQQYTPRQGRTYKIPYMMLLIVFSSLSSLPQI